MMRAKRASSYFREALLIENQGCASRDFKGGSLRSRSLSTTPLASFLGSLPLLSPGKEKNCVPETFWTALLWERVAQRAGCGHHGRFSVSSTRLQASCPRGRWPLTSQLV